MGEGKTLEEAREQIGMVIEGVDNIEVAYELAKKHNVDMPIVNAVYDMLFNGLDPKEGVGLLMTRDKKAESEVGGQIGSQKSEVGGRKIGEFLRRKRDFRVVVIY